MRSLFAKILLWFLASVTITGVALVYTTALNVNDQSLRQSPLTMLLRLSMRDLQSSYESGGREALQSTLLAMQTTLGNTLYFTDAKGTDLITGADRRALLEEARVRSRLPFVRGSGIIISRRSIDGRYWLIFATERKSWMFWYLQPEHLWILGIMVVLCYGLAYHLTSPVRALQRAVDRFGHGDLTARAATTRGDELGQLAGTFNQMAERTETLLNAERRLLLDISHELRSPLARLSVAVELARQSSTDERSLNRIQKEAERLNALVGELLQVTRAEGDASRLRTEEVPLDRLLLNLVEDCSIEAQARGCTLDLDSPRAIAVQGDSELLRRAIENVLRNAIRYAPADTAIEVRAVREDGWAKIRIRDYGPGVPEESLPHIFDPFYRVDSHRNRESGGVGLGLAIAKRAVDLHRGKLTAVNMSPGLLVEIDIPLPPENHPVAESAKNMAQSP